MLGGERRPQTAQTLPFASFCSISTRARNYIELHRITYTGGNSAMDDHVSSLDPIIYIYNIV